jgi:hypothetical protein
MVLGPQTMAKTKLRAVTTARPVNIPTVSAAMKEFSIVHL